MILSIVCFGLVGTGQVQGATSFTDRTWGKVQVEWKVRREQTCVGLHVSSSYTWHNETYGAERTQWYEHEFVPEVKFFVPIRVANSTGPQLVAYVTRANWADYLIFAPSDGDVKKVFSFSCRDSSAVSWKATNGRLMEITTYDKFEPVPERLARQAKGDQRWMLVSTWTWDRTNESWKQSSKKWSTYRSGHDLPVPKEDLPRKFSFAWPD